jgi:hypothetical protein
MNRTSIELNKEVFDNIQITSQENMILKSLEKFYIIDENINLFMNIVNTNSHISIRLIDYFITKYSKNHNVIYKYNDENINIYTSYKQQLKAFQKKHFDPFSRGDRIPYFMGNICIITTIGQLNFFRWFLSRNVLDYIINNQAFIEHDMNHKNKIEKKPIKLLSKTKKTHIKSHITCNKLLYNTTKTFTQPTSIIVSFN